MIPVFFVITMFIVILVNFVSKRAERQNQQTTQAFIEKEQTANTTRKKDISNLDFITIPVCISTPTGLISEEITDTEQQLSALSEKKIVNFTGITNTELKLAYGAPNIDILSEYDNNYLKLVRLLQKYATLLYDNNLKDKAIEVLEFSLSTKSDISASYTLLARIYKEQGRTEDIKKVIEKAESLDSMTKGKLLKDLNEILDSTD